MRGTYTALDEALPKSSSWRKTEINELLEELGLGFHSFNTFKMGDDKGNDEVFFEYAFEREVGYNRNSPDVDYFSAWKFRVAYVIAYAHWEGFVKSTVQLYLRHLDHVSIDDYEQHPRLVGNALKYKSSGFKKEYSDKLDQFHKKVNGKGAKVNLLGVLSPFGEALSVEPLGYFQDSSIDLDEALVAHLTDTGSNLKFDRFKELMLKLDLEIDRFFWTNKDTIDELVQIRNGIAHGDANSRFREFGISDDYRLPKTLHFLNTAFDRLSDAILTKAEETL